MSDNKAGNEMGADSSYQGDVEVGSNPYEVLAYAILILSKLGVIDFLPKGVEIGVLGDSIEMMVNEHYQY